MSKTLFQQLADDVSSIVPVHDFKSKEFLKKLTAQHQRIHLKTSFLHTTIPQEALFVVKSNWQSLCKYLEEQHSYIVQYCLRWASIMRIKFLKRLWAIGCCTLYFTWLMALNTAAMMMKLNLLHCNSAEPHAALLMVAFEHWTDGLSTLRNHQNEMASRIHNHLIVEKDSAQ